MTRLNFTALTIIAILVLVLHVSAGGLLGRSPAHASIAMPDEEAMCPTDATPQAPSLPFD